MKWCREQVDADWCGLLRVLIHKSQNITLEETLETQHDCYFTDEKTERKVPMTRLRSCFLCSLQWYSMLPIISLLLVSKLLQLYNFCLLFYFLSCGFKMILVHYTIEQSFLKGAFLLWFLSLRYIYIMATKVHVKMQWVKQDIKW